MDSNDNMNNLRVASFACYLDTAKDNMVHQVSNPSDNSGKSNLNPVARAPFSIKFSKPHDNGLSHLRVDSFSYINGEVDNRSSNNNNFVFEVPGPIQDPTTAFTFSRQDLPGEDGRGEISVFGADKYFNMKIESNQGKKFKEDEYGPVPLVDLAHSVKPSSPSIQSEASTWNSQTALMTNTHQVNHQTKQKSTLGKKLFAGFGCKAPCFAKKDIPVTDSSKPVRAGSESMGHPYQGTNKNVLEESRHSIEVFGSRAASTKGSDIAANMERKLSMLTWDAIPKGGSKNHPTSTPCDDMASEASSDLFEIENISGSMYHLLTSEPVSSCTMSPTSQYAPSETSIQWSVVTASAVDYSVALSDYNCEPNITNVVPNLVQTNNNVIVNANCKISEGKEMAHRILPGGLLGCKNLKSVDVAENVYPKTKNQGLDLSHPFGKSQGRVKINHIDTLHLPVKSYNSHP